MKLRSFFTVLTVGVLLLTTVHGYATAYLVRSEYHAYRDGLFARSYESALQLLSDYLRTGEGDGPGLTARLWELPLSDGERETVRRLTADMAAGKTDEAAKKRATAYAEDLFRHLSGRRSLSYRESWRASGLQLPPYPEEEKPVSATPEDPAAYRRWRAERLLENDNLIAYTREEDGLLCYGFRTASAFAELGEDGTLLRLLRRDRTDGSGASEEDCRREAMAFLDRWVIPLGEPVLTEAMEPGFRFTFREGETTAVVGVESASGKTVFFLREGSSRP